MHISISEENNNYHITLLPPVILQTTPPVKKTNIKLVLEAIGEYQKKAASVLYPNNLMIWFWASSVLPSKICPHSCLAYRQWSLAPDRHLKEPPCPIPKSSSCLGITQLSKTTGIEL
jgi:hypothetical protein